MSLPRRIICALLFVPLAFFTTGCTSDSTSSPAPGGSAMSAEAYAAIIDVRTPEEFAAGHVPGAVNLDVQSPQFADQVAALDPQAGTYLIYCRSGNRSAVAAEQMRAAGLTVTDGGGLSDMEAAGWEIR